MKIVVCSMGYSGYSAACWRSLDVLIGGNLKIFTPETHQGYTVEILNGLNAEVVDDQIFVDARYVAKIADQIAKYNPDTILIGGWSAKPFGNLAYASAFGRFASLCLSTPCGNGIGVVCFSGSCPMTVNEKFSQDVMSSLESTHEGWYNDGQKC